MRNLASRVFRFETIKDLNKYFDWKLPNRLPIDSYFGQFTGPEDINSRRLLDAQVLGLVVKNLRIRTALDIGTAEGRSAAIMAINSPGADIYTVNIDPCEEATGAAGNMTTIALSRSDIGSYYRSLHLKNIHQIIANTANWHPNLPPLDLVFIDGCHDTKFIINDTKNILPFLKPNGFILWHDFNPENVRHFDWVSAVCRGVDKLLSAKLISGPVFYVKNSWIGISRIP